VQRLCRLGMMAGRVQWVGEGMAVDRDTAGRGSYSRGRDAITPPCTFATVQANKPSLPGNVLAECLPPIKPRWGGRECFNGQPARTSDKYWRTGVGPGKLGNRHNLHPTRGKGKGPLSINCLTQGEPENQD
jgi:hypothetical protein